MPNLYLGTQKVCPVIKVGRQPSISSLSITPTTSQKTIYAPAGTDGYNPITVSPVTSSVDSNITAENIKKNVTILGVTGTYEGKISYFYADEFDHGEFYDVDSMAYYVGDIILAQASVPSYDGRTVLNYITVVAILFYDENGNFYYTTPYITDTYFDSTHGYINGICAVGPDRIINFEDGLYVGDLIGVSDTFLNLGEFLMTVGV